MVQGVWGSIPDWDICVQIALEADRDIFDQDSLYSSQYFTSYYIESRHLCEILKSEGLGWEVKGKKSHFVELRVTYLGKCT